MKTITLRKNFNIAVCMLENTEKKNLLEKLEIERDTVDLKV